MGEQLGPPDPPADVVAKWGVGGAGPGEPLPDRRPVEPDPLEEAATVLIEALRPHITDSAKARIRPSFITAARRLQAAGLLASSSLSSGDEHALREADVFALCRADGCGILSRRGDEAKKKTHDACYCCGGPVSLFIRLSDVRVALAKLRVTGGESDDG